ncbi:hypothetical protein [Yoonia sp.]|uniref:hypothetical protein n=1 Tax=Yoonia sp. TaxID=2212373 RepID=UPI00358F8D3D
MKRVLGLLLLTSFSPLAAFAQEAEPGGVFYSLDFDQTFEASTDQDLTTEAEEDGLVSLTSLGFEAVTETRTQRLSFEFGSRLRGSEGEFSDDRLNALLAYSRNSADALFEVSLQSLHEDIAFLRDVSDFISDDGEIILPDDFDDLTGGGIRTETVFATSFIWGETAPVGYELRASQQILRYEDASSDLIDSDTVDLSFGVRLDLNAVTTGNIGLSYSQTDEVGSPLTELTTLSGALTFARPLGELTTQISASRDENDDIFWAALVERDFEISNGDLSGAIGFVEDENGDARLTGRIDLSFPRPSGQFDFSLAHSLSPGEDRASTTFSAGYLQELSPVSSMQVGFDFLQTSNPDGSDVLATAGLSASYGVSLTENWQMNVGARVDLLDDDGDRSTSNTVFLTLERPFSWRP